MIKEKFDLFWVFYVFVIETLADNNSEGFNQFLNDANPFIWEGQSWDPSIYDDFSSKFEQNGSFDENGYSFIMSFLDCLDGIYYDVKQLKEYILKENYIALTTVIFNNGFNSFFEKYGIKK